MRARRYWTFKRYSVSDSYSSALTPEGVIHASMPSKHGPDTILVCIKTSIVIDVSLLSI